MSRRIESNTGCTVVVTNQTVVVEPPFAGYGQHDTVLKQVVARKKPSKRRGPWGAKHTMTTSLSADQEGLYCFNAKKKESLRGENFFFSIQNGVVTPLGTDFEPTQGVDY